MFRYENYVGAYRTGQSRSTRQKVLRIQNPRNLLAAAREEYMDLTIMNYFNFMCLLYCYYRNVKKITITFVTLNSLEQQLLFFM
jgi:hypothetical protein